MSKLKLTNLETGEEYQIDQIEEIPSGTKYVMHIFVGNMDPLDVPTYMTKCLGQVQSFFGEANLLLLPFRDGENKAQIFAIKETEGDKE